MTAQAGFTISKLVHTNHKIFGSWPGIALFIIDLVQEKCLEMLSYFYNVIEIQKKKK